MGKYKKDYDMDSSESMFEEIHKSSKESQGENERGWKNSKKKSKQFRQARKKRSLRY